MKKILSVILLSLTFIISACSGTEIDINTAADTLVSELEFSEELAEISASVQMKRYGLDKETVIDAKGYAGTKAVVDEVVVFKCNDTEAVMNAANEHIELQIKNYTSYAPNEVHKLNDAVIETVGDCVIVCVSNTDSNEVKTKIDGLAK